MRIEASIPARGGAGLKAEHYRDILTVRPDIGFFEVHAENYMGAGGPPHRYLEAIRESYPVSLHGVGLSIGGNLPLDRAHLARLKALNSRYEPGLFSEHLAWSTHSSGYLADLLPVPYTDEALKRICEHIDTVQSEIGRQMLLENPSSYMSFKASTYSETAFIAEIVRRTGCGLLLDVNNVFVSAGNLQFDPQHYLADYPLEHVGEIHLGGHDRQVEEDGSPVLIDDHAHPVSDAVWQLYAFVIDRIGPRPTLIERDAAVPPLAELVAEVHRADRLLNSARNRRAA